MAIIALSGYKFSGKDTAAKLLVDNHGFKRIAFADFLKDMVASQYGIERTSFDAVSLKEAPILFFPVDPQDDFSKMITGFLRKEFRTASGQVPEPGQKAFWTPRALAILEGSIKRSVNSKYWVENALKSIQPNENVVITDMRYRSEMTQIADFANDKKQKLLTVRVDRFDSSPSSDPSERDLDGVKFDIRLSNKGSLDDLALSVDFLVSQI